MSSQRRVSGTTVQRTIAVLGSAVFFVVAPCILAGLIPWLITGWQLQPPFLGLELTRGIGAILILAGVPGRGGTETLQRETRKCVNEPRHACENQYRADAARQLQIKERRLELPIGDQPWNEPRQRTWGDHEENRRAQDGTGSLHRGSRQASLRAHSNLSFMVSHRHPSRFGSKADMDIRQFLT